MDMTRKTVLLNGACTDDMLNAGLEAAGLVGNLMRTESAMTMDAASVLLVMSIYRAMLNAAPDMTQLDSVH